MYQLEKLHAVQYFLVEAQTLDYDRTTAVIAPNGSGKSALLDAIQIVLLGGDQNAIRLNAQAGGDADGRSIREYCLGFYTEKGHARDHATTFLTLVFRDTTGRHPPISAGIALGATINEAKHVVYGMYLITGLALELADHLEAVDGGTQPMAWATFKANVQARCKQHDARAEFEARSASTFTKGLLFAMRPDSARDVNPGAFRKAFKNALNLTRVPDTDHFIRHLIAEERPINLERFREQLESFRELRRKIAEVITRITSADAIQNLYVKAAATRMHRASYQALVAEYRRDEHYDALELGQQEVTTANADMDAALRVAEQADSRAQASQATLMALTQEARARPEFGRDQAIDDAQLDKLGSLKKQLTLKLQRIADAFASVLRGDPTATAWAVAGRPWATLLDRVRATGAGQALGLAPANEEKSLDETLPMLTALMDAAKREARAAIDLREQTEATAKRLDAALTRANEGRVQLRDAVMHVRRAIEDAGITATPVCDLTRITDASWAPAIEGYLRNNIDALLIEPGREDEAIAIYEAIPASYRAFNVKIVTADRRRSGGATLPKEALSHLIAGTNETAVAFLRARLGRLRQLERASRDSEDGLTRTGMLVKDGSVERLWLPAESELKVGQRDARDRRQALASQKHEADEALRDAQRHEGKLKRILDAGVALATVHNDVRDVADLLQEHLAVEERRATLALARREGLAPDLIELQVAIETAQAAEQSARSQASEANERKGRTRQAAEQAQRALDVLEQQSEEFERVASTAFRAPYVDATWLDGKRAELEATDRALVNHIGWCLERIAAADKAYPAQQSAAWSELSRHGNAYEVTIVFAPDDLDAAQALLCAELQRLRDSELASYERQADEAYAVATRTFRSRIAAQLSSQFDDLRLQLRTLNAILDNSPAFTNDERYHFKMMPAPEHKALYEFICTVAQRGAEDNLFEEPAHAPEQFRTLLEEAATSHRTLLEDYRLFFTFDVEVRQHGIKISTLGARMRSGSGGEHRAPLFVVAGAALAAAYGKSQGDSTGLSLIVLDELGDKIDEENMRAVFQYLRGLGLQPLVAAPGLALGALSSSLDSYIELYRADDTLMIQHIALQPAARELLSSDLPSVNPVLLASATQAIEAERRRAP